MVEALRRATRIIGLSMGGMMIVGLAACGIGSSSEDALIEEGMAIYERYCLNCHGEAGTGEGGLANAPVHGPLGHTWHHPDWMLREMILGTFDYPQKTMPSFVGKLSDSDVEAVLEYIKSGWDTPQIVWQKEVTLKWSELNQGKDDQ